MSQKFNLQVRDDAAAGEASALLVSLIKGLTQGVTTVRRGDGGYDVRLAPEACQAAVEDIANAFGRAIGRVMEPLFQEGYKAGYAQAQAVRPANPPRLVSDRTTVERDPHTGEITASVTRYQYEDAAGEQQQPL